MDRMENAVRELLDALVCAQPELERVDPMRSIDENVTATGVAERYVKAYIVGRKALGS